MLADLTYFKRHGIQDPAQLQSFLRRPPTTTVPGDVLLYTRYALPATIPPPGGSSALRFFSQAKQKSAKRRGKSDKKERGLNGQLPR